MIDPSMLRQELGRWLDQRPRVSYEDEPESLEDAMAEERILQRDLWDEGFTKHGWPESLGGAGGTAILRAVAYEELVQRGHRIPQAMLSVETLGPAVVAFAPELADRFLAPVVRGDEIWCQGFSEPEAGSDLGSLRCRALPVEGGWQVTGQKTWSTFGHLADRCALLVRTGESGARGISMLLVDLDGPGCEVRPIKAASGRSEFAELFFDEVFVPADRLVGEPDGGWKVAMFLLQWERGMYGWQRQAIMHRRLANLPATGANGAAKVADALVKLTALRSLTARTVQRLAVGESPGPEVSIDKIVLATAEQAVLDAQRTIECSRFILGGEPADEVLRADWFYSRAGSVYGGAIEIQRSILAERVLGLPKTRAAR